MQPNTRKKKNLPSGKTAGPLQSTSKPDDLSPGSRYEVAKLQYLKQQKDYNFRQQEKMLVQQAPGAAAGGATSATMTPSMAGAAAPSPGAPLVDPRNVLFLDLMRQLVLQSNITAGPPGPPPAAFGSAQGPVAGQGGTTSPMLNRIGGHHDEQSFLPDSTSGRRDPPVIRTESSSSGAPGSPFHPVLNPFGITLPPNALNRQYAQNLLKNLKKVLIRIRKLPAPFFQIEKEQLSRLILQAAEQEIRAFFELDSTSSVGGLLEQNNGTTPTTSTTTATSSKNDYNYPGGAPAQENYLSNSTAFKNTTRTFFVQHEPGQMMNFAENNKDPRRPPHDPSCTLVGFSLELVKAADTADDQEAQAFLWHRRGGNNFSLDRTTSSPPGAGATAAASGEVDNSFLNYRNAAATSLFPSSPPFHFADLREQQQNQWFLYLTRQTMDRESGTKSEKFLVAFLEHIPAISTNARMSGTSSSGGGPGFTNAAAAQNINFPPDSTVDSENQNQNLLFTTNSTTSWAADERGSSPTTHFSPAGQATLLNRTTTSTSTGGNPNREPLFHVELVPIGSASATSTTKSTSDVLEQDHHFIPSQEHQILILLSQLGILHYLVSKDAALTKKIIAELRSKLREKYFESCSSCTSRSATSPSASTKGKTTTTRSNLVTMKTTVTEVATTTSGTAPSTGSLLQGAGASTQQRILQTSQFAVVNGKMVNTLTTSGGAVPGAATPSNAAEILMESSPRGTLSTAASSTSGNNKMSNKTTSNNRQNTAQHLLDSSKNSTSNLNSVDPISTRRPVIDVTEFCLKTPPAFLFAAAQMNRFNVPNNTTIDENSSFHLDNNFYKFYWPAIVEGKEADKSTSSGTSNTFDSSSSTSSKALSVSSYTFRLCRKCGSACKKHADRLLMQFPSIFEQYGIVLATTGGAHNKPVCADRLRIYLLMKAVDEGLLLLPEEQRKVQFYGKSANINYARGFARFMPKIMWTVKTTSAVPTIFHSITYSLPPVDAKVVYDDPLNPTGGLLYCKDLARCAQQEQEQGHHLIFQHKNDAQQQGDENEDKPKQQEEQTLDALDHYLAMINKVLGGTLSEGPPQIELRKSPKIENLLERIGMELDTSLIQWKPLRILVVNGERSAVGFGKDLLLDRHQEQIEEMFSRLGSSDYSISSGPTSSRTSTTMPSSGTDEQGLILSAEDENDSDIHREVVRDDEGEEEELSGPHNPDDYHFQGESDDQTASNKRTRGAAKTTTRVKIMNKTPSRTSSSPAAPRVCRSSSASSSSSLYLDGNYVRDLYHLKAVDTVKKFKNLAASKDGGADVWYYFAHAPVEQIRGSRVRVTGREVIDERNYNAENPDEEETQQLLQLPGAAAGTTGPTADVEISSSAPSALKHVKQNLKLGKEEIPLSELNAFLQELSDDDKLPKFVILLGCYTHTAGKVFESYGVPTVCSQGQPQREVACRFGLGLLRRVAKLLVESVHDRNNGRLLFVSEEIPAKKCGLRRKLEQCFEEERKRFFSSSTSTRDDTNQNVNGRQPTWSRPTASKDNATTFDEEVDPADERAGFPRAMRRNEEDQQLQEQRAPLLPKSTSTRGSAAKVSAPVSGEDDETVAPLAARTSSLEAERQPSRRLAFVDENKQSNVEKNPAASGVVPTSTPYQGEQRVDAQLEDLQQHLSISEDDFVLLSEPAGTGFTRQMAIDLKTALFGAGNMQYGDGLSHEKMLEDRKKQARAIWIAVGIIALVACLGLALGLYYVFCRGGDNNAARTKDEKAFNSDPRLVWLREEFANEKERLVGSTAHPAEYLELLETFLEDPTTPRSKYKVVQVLAPLGSDLLQDADYRREIEYRAQAGQRVSAVWVSPGLPLTLPDDLPSSGKNQFLKTAADVWFQFSTKMLPQMKNNTAANNLITQKSGTRRQPELSGHSSGSSSAEHVVTLSDFDFEKVQVTPSDFDFEKVEVSSNSEHPWGNRDVFPETYRRYVGIWGDKLYVQQKGRNRVWEGFDPPQWILVLNALLGFPMDEVNGLKDKRLRGMTRFLMRDEGGTVRPPDDNFNATSVQLDHEGNVLKPVKEEDLKRSYGQLSHRRNWSEDRPVAMYYVFIEPAP
ncbi:unnamed protein product [Amoebophrya sp. A120]|nr:unnamed protein product [Amoebophrya sp. A120]|eukprot:GSA120T00024146001.1